LCPASHLRGRSVQVHRTLAGIFGCSRTIEKTSALDIQIAETLGLKPIGQNTKQELVGGNSLSNFARVDVIFSSRPRPAAFSERPVVLPSDRSAAVPFFDCRIS
jgi:hypothetical protein